MTWHRDVFSESVWESELSTAAKIVALSYADHARDGDVSWVTWPRLIDRTSLSRASISRHVRVLVDGGWLELIEPGRQHRSPRYRLCVPTEQRAQGETPETPPEEPSGLTLASSGLTTESTGINLRPDHSSTSPPTGGEGRSQGNQDEAAHRETPEEAEAVRALRDRHGTALTSETALAAVRAVVAKKRPSYPARYMAGFSLDDVQTWAGKKVPEAEKLPGAGKRPAAVVGIRCSHGFPYAADGGSGCSTCPDLDTIALLGGLDERSEAS